MFIILYELHVKPSGIGANAMYEEEYLLFTEHWLDAEL